MSGSADSQQPQSGERQSTASREEGIKALIDFTKFLTGVSGAGIAYIVSNASEFNDNLLNKISVTIAVVCFAVSFVAGCLVLLGTAGKLIDGGVNFDDPTLRGPGRLNVLAAVVGAIALAVVVVAKIW
jgi:hypothetical protein